LSDFAFVGLFTPRFHAGCGFGGGLGFDSGLLSAVSSHEALVGLQRFGSIVLEGLTGSSVALEPEEIEPDLESGQDGNEGFTKPSFMS
jgi:hypothetical protein